MGHRSRAEWWWVMMWCAVLVALAVLEGFNDVHDVIDSLLLAVSLAACGRFRSHKRTSICRLTSRGRCAGDYVRHRAIARWRHIG